MRRAIVAITLMLSATPARAQGIEAWQAPTLTTMRYDEDWQTLSDPGARTGRWTERFKYVPIGDDGAYLVSGLELRARNENNRASLWGGAPAPDDGYLWLRALPYGDLHAGRFRAFVQPVMAYAIGMAPAASPVDRTGLDILQAFADVRFGEGQTGDTEGIGVTIRAGREMMSFGNERLIGTRYGPNVPLAFDGVRAIVTLPGATVDLIDKRPVRAGLRDFDDHSDRNRRVSGVYARVPTAKGGIEFYWLRYRNVVATFADGDGHEVRYSIGGHAHHASATWHWDSEAVFQYGRLNASRIRAWTGSLEIGRKFAGVALSPDATIRANIVSGDRRIGDGRLETFNALFPRGMYFGELSPLGPYNIVSVNPRVTLSLSDRITAGAAAMAYWRYSTGDGVYDIPGNLIRQPGRSRARSIGRQVETFVSWQATPELEVSGSLSAFVAGPFLRETGPHATIGMAAFETNFRF